MSWSREAFGFMRVEMARRKVTYKKLAVRLEAMGVDETAKSVASKISRGSFSFVFFLQAMKALNVQKVDLSRLYDVDFLRLDAQDEDARQKAIKQRRKKQETVIPE